MPSGKAADHPGHNSTGNVLEDLEFTPQEIREMEIKQDLWVPIRAEIEARKLTQVKVAEELQIHQPDANLLLRGQIARFSISRLMQFADRLQLAVTLTVSPKAQAVAQRAARIPLRKASPRKPPTRPGASPRRPHNPAFA